jgi:hypothetical protein
MRRRGMGPGPGRMAARRMAARMVRRTQRRRRRRRRRRVILVGGLIALGIHKLTSRDVQRVEEHTGKTAEELTDEELEQAMDELGIEAEEMTDEEMDYVDQQDPPQEDYIEELQRLSSLRDQGIISDEEFEAKKKQLLDL